MPVDYVCSTCLVLSQFDVCEICGDSNPYAVTYEPSQEKGHYKVFVDGSYQGTIYRAPIKFSGEPYLRFNEKERKAGKLVVEEHTPRHTSKFKLWTFRQNQQTPFKDYGQAVVALITRGWKHETQNQ